MGDDQTGGGKQARFGLGVTEFHDQVNHVSANETILNGGFNGAYVGGLYFANPAAPATYLHSIRSSHSSSVDAQNILDFSVNDHTGANAVDVMSLDGSGQATFHGLLNMASSALLPRNASDPGTCTAGQIEFNSTSTAFKGCAATNTWSSLGSGGSSGGTGAASGGGASVLTLGTDCSAATPCNYRWSNRVVAITTSAAATQSGGTGTTYEYVDFTSGRFTVAIPGGMTVTCNANCDVVAGTAFPVDSIPLYRWVVTLAGAWNMAQANYNVRSVYSVSPATAGANLTSSFVSGKQTFSLDPTSAFVVTGSVDDTGASVTKPSRTVPGSPSGACSANNEVVLSTATGNLFTCTAGVWHLVGGGATGGGTTVGGVTTVSTSTAYPMLSTIRQGITNFTNATPPAVSIAQAGTGGFDNLWCEIVQWLPATNSNNGLVITPASPSTINGNAALTLFVGGQSKICSDGVNYTATVPVPVWMEDNGYAVGIYHGVRILDSNYPLSENTTAQTCATTATLGGTNGDEITLTGNCTLSIGSPGFAETEKTVKICQDATGNHTVTWPATMHAPMTVSAGASTCSVQVFQGFASNNVWYAMSPGVTGQ